VILDILTGSLCLRKLIKAIGDSFWDNGTCGEYLGNVDGPIRAVLGGINTPLIEYLIERIGYHDTGLVDMLYGAPILGNIGMSGDGQLRKYVDIGASGELWNNRHRTNRKMAKSIRPAAHDSEVMNQTIEDQKLGEVSQPVLYDEAKCQFGGIFSSRFGVAQGEGVRRVGNATSSGANPCPGAAGKISGHLLDTIFLLAQYFYWVGFVGLGAFKPDVKAASRRVPIMASHRWPAGIFLMFEEFLYWALHYAVPFGFVCAVYSWERFANFPWFAAVKLLLVPLEKYVDDFFGVKQAAHMGTALESVAGLFTAIMGTGS
jgi:hypothetical protein